MHAQYYCVASCNLGADAQYLLQSLHPKIGRRFGLSVESLFALKAKSLQDIRIATRQPSFGPLPHPSCRALSCSETLPSATCHP